MAGIEKTMKLIGKDVVKDCTFAGVPNCWLTQ
jgi:hypothetical protein